jgi:hypothetical protein
MLRSITPPSISTSPCGIWMQSPTRSIPSRSQPRLRAVETGGSGRDEPAHPRGGRHRPRSGQQLLGEVRISPCMAPSQGVRCHRPLPHCGTGWASRSVPPLWPSGRLVQLMPQPALPQVPGQRACQVADRRSLLGTEPCADPPATAICPPSCPLCSGPMIVLERITAQDLRYALIPIRQPAHALDSS